MENNMLVIEKSNVEFLRLEESDNRTDCLFKITVFDVEKFGIYISDNGESALSFFQGTFERAVDIFEMIRHGKLSAIHLEEVMVDLCGENTDEN